MQRNGRHLSEKLLATCQLQETMPKPSVLYYLANEPYYEDIMKNAELLLEIVEKARTEISGRHITYAHVIRHILLKSWTSEMKFTLEQSRLIYAAINQEYK